MFYFSQLQRIAASSILTLLAACGGGVATTPAELTAPGWASPAVFVPAGKESISIELQACGLYNNNIVPFTFEPLDQARININSAGDVSFVASNSATGTVTTYVEIKSADASSFAWQVSGSLATPTYDLSIRKISGSGFKAIGFGFGHGTGFGSSNIFIIDSNVVEVSNCQMLNTLSLQITPSQARAAKFLGSQSGINTYDPYIVQDGRIEAGNSYFSLTDRGGGFAFAPELAPTTHIRFNLNTGELDSNTRSSAVTATYAPIDLNIPATSLSGTGSYSEQFCRNDFNFDFDYKDVRLLSLGKFNLDQSYLLIGAAAYDNKFMPRSQYVPYYPNQSCPRLF